MPHPFQWNNMPIQNPYQQALDSLQKYGQGVTKSIPGSALMSPDELNMDASTAPLGDVQSTLYGYKDRLASETADRLMAAQRAGDTNEVTALSGFLGRNKQDITEDPLSQQNAQTEDISKQNQEANMLGFTGASPAQSAAIYGRTQAQKAAESKQGLERAQAGLAGGQEVAQRAAAGESTNRGIAERVRAQAALEQARNYSPAGVGGPATKAAVGLIQQKEELQNNPGPWNQITDFLGRHGVPGISTIDQRIQSKNQQIQDIQRQQHPGTAPTVSGVTTGGGGGAAVPSVGPRGGDMPPSEVDALQPGEVFETHEGAVWGKRANGTVVRIR